MPPKTKGHNLRGKTKIFRNAVDYVRIGVGHTILGNVSLQLVAEPNNQKNNNVITDSKSTTQGKSGSLASIPNVLSTRPAFYLELNEQMLSHSSKDFKKFRYDVSPLCETEALFKMNHKEIAERLIKALLARQSGTFSTSKVQRTKELLHHKNASQKSEADEDEDNVQKGDSTEAFEAFARLTIAFARDMQERFFPYFEVFQKAVHAGLFDGHGQIIPDTNRLQLVFSVQAAWCREMLSHWTNTANRALVLRVIRMYLAQWKDTKDYIRRLTGELLAYLCRICRPMLSMVISESLRMIADDYNKFKQDEIEADNEQAENKGDEEGEENQNISDNDEEKHESSTNTSGKANVQPNEDEDNEYMCFMRFVQRELPVNATADGFVSFAADLFRGIRGSLSSSMEYYYIRLLQQFHLISTVDLERNNDFFSAFLSEEIELASDEVERPVAVTSQEGVVANDAIYTSLVKEFGSFVLQQALIKVLLETRKTSKKIMDNLDDDNEPDDIDDDEEIGNDFVNDADRETIPSHRILTIVVQSLSASADKQQIKLCGSLLSCLHGLLWNDIHELAGNHQVFAKFLIASVKSASAKVKGVLNNKKDDAFHEEELAELRSAIALAATTLECLIPLCLTPYLESEYNTFRDEEKALTFTLKKQKLFLPAAKEAVELLTQLSNANSILNNGSHSFPHSDKSSEILSNRHIVFEEAMQVLLAFAQDVYQKNYAFCLEEERRMAELGLDVRHRLQEQREETYYTENEDVDAEDFSNEGTRSKKADLNRKRSRDGSKTHEGIIPSLLSPFAITVLHTICQWMWQQGNKVLEICEKKSSTDITVSFAVSAERIVEKSILLMGMSKDQTQHMECSPLRQLLRAKNTSSKEQQNKNHNNSGGEDLSQTLQKFILLVASSFVRQSSEKVSGQKRNNFSLLFTQKDFAQYLSALLPVVFILPNQDELGKQIEQKLRQILEICLDLQKNAQEEQQSAGGNGMLIGVENATIYSSLYTQIAALLVHLTSGNKIRGGNKKKSKSVLPLQDKEQVNGFQHLEKTIHLLSSQFERTTGRTNVDRSMLFHATELLLESLAVCLDCSTQTASKETVILKDSTLIAMSQLKEALSIKAQRELLFNILTECLTAPHQRLRLASIRLLRLFSHPKINFGCGGNEHYKPEKSSVKTSLMELDWRDENLANMDPNTLLSLQRAEEFNPLSQVGDLNGLKEALNKISFDAERGVIHHSLQRVIIARSMIGLLHLKFSMAWPIALAILVGLVRNEQTAEKFSDIVEEEQMSNEDEEEREDGGDNTVAEKKKAAAKTKLPPLVWETVVRHYARLLVFGDIIEHEKHHATQSDLINETYAVLESESKLEADKEAMIAKMETLPCHYWISWTDQQRHSSGELVSQAFSSNAYHTSAFTLATAVTNELELISWKRHCNNGIAFSTMNGSGADIANTTTNSSTLAQTFLQGLSDMMKDCAPFDSKIQLVEQLVEELVSIHRGEHPDGLVQVKNLEGRLALAMQACALAPSTALTPGEVKRFTTKYGAPVTRELIERNDKLALLFTSYISFSDARVQRAALHNLRRLKKKPFSAYYKQLTPYCDDNLKDLFNFLTTFRVDVDIPVEDRTEYISTALSIALPKLTSKVSKTKLRDQAVLSRRLLSFLSHLEEGQSDESAIVQVLNPLVERLLFSRVTANNQESISVSSGSAFLRTFYFLENWESQVQERRQLGWNTLRKVEQLQKQMVSALKMLEALLNAAGQQFEDYVVTCLVLTLNVYLFSCKGLFREPVEKLREKLLQEQQKNSRETDHSSAAETERLLRWCNATLLTISHSKSFNQSVSSLRKSAVQIVLALSEQFPDIVANSVFVDCHSHSSVYETYFGKFISHLSRHHQSTSFSSQDKNDSGEHLNQFPMMKLVMTWVNEPAFHTFLSAFSKEVLHTFQEAFALSSFDADQKSGKQKVFKSSSEIVFVALRCVTDILKRADAPVMMISHSGEHWAMKNKTKGKKKTSDDEQWVTLKESFVKPYMLEIFGYIYHLITRGAEVDGSVRDLGLVDDQEQHDVEINQKVENGESEVARSENVTGNKKKKKVNSKNDNASKNKSSRYSVMSFTANMWKEIIQTVSLLTKEQFDVTSKVRLSTASEQGISLQKMLERLLEVSLKFIVHPICSADSNMLHMSCAILLDLCTGIQTVDVERHFLPFVHIFNVMNHPVARVKMCNVLNIMLTKLPTSDIVVRHEKILFNDSFNDNDNNNNNTMKSKMCEAYQSQLIAVGRAVSLLNRFEDDSFERYDFEARYHAFNVLMKFFSLDKSSGNSAKNAASSTSSVHLPVAPSPSLKTLLEKGDERQGVRYERSYTGEDHIELVTDQQYAPFLCSEAFQLLSANTMFFLRDSEKTIRAFAVQLLKAMSRYASASCMADHLREKRKPNEKHLTPQVFASYEHMILEEVFRREVLHSLRRGIVAKDTVTRHEHMSSFEVFGKYYASSFPSFALLYNSNTDQNFYKNINHVQPKCRLNALALLRKEAPNMHVRDLLRVFIPFLIAAVKDFAQGKRQLPNMTEGRAKGYCEAVLFTVATIAEKLPWEAYHRVLTLFLANANLNPSLRMPMLRGVVQVLNTFHFLDAAAEGEEEEKDVAVTEPQNNADDDIGDEMEAESEDEEGAEVQRIAQSKARQFRHAKIARVLETDIIPQLYAYINEDGGKEGKKALGIVDGRANLHSIANVRRQMEKENSDVTKNAILQLPVAIAITKIVKHFPEEKFNLYVETLLDWLVKRLRTKNDKHRESARRILGIMLQETGPSKLKFLVTKLKDNLVHGYQLHVLGYTVVTLLYQLYDPQNSLVNTSKKISGASSQTQNSARDKQEEELLKIVAGNASGKKSKQQLTQDSDNGHNDSEEDEGEESAAKRLRMEGLTEEERLELEEEEVIHQLTSSAGKTNFDYYYGVQCLTNIMDDLMLIFLDDYLGDVGHEKEQVELMSKMIEVKSNRSVQGFSFLAKHCQAEKVMETFLHRITWVLTPPSDKQMNISELEGSNKIRALLQQDLQNKYRTSGKNVSADLVFVNKVRLLAVRVARNLMINPTVNVEQSFQQVLQLMNKHNTVREEKIAAFEAKDGSRRIRSNAYTLIHEAERKSYKQKLESTFLIPKAPERVDLDFSSHTVLNTQQKNKLRVYKGRYGKEVREAAKDFYREDPTAAVVLDTVDEFLLKYLLSMLKHVLGIGKEKKYSKAAVELDMLRRRKQRLAEQQETGEIISEENVEDADENETKNAQTEEEDAEADEEADEISVKEIDSSSDDDLDHFVEQQDKSDVTKGKKKDRPITNKDQLISAFTREHKAILETLVPAVLQTLKGEGSDAVVALALDSLLALASFRPPLEAVKKLENDLFQTVLVFFERGGAIKQRAMRVSAAVLGHSNFQMQEDLATRLVSLCRSEIIDRSVFLPMALSLLYAILSKHIHIPEIYDIIDLVTELLVHMGNKIVIRRRCVSVLVRFLTEYKMTPQKFRSHMEMFVKNLDFPDLAGRLGLLEVLEALVIHLPTVILRNEATLLFLPLSATLTSCEWKAGREKAGHVMQLLARNAGVDVLAPFLISSFAEGTSRATRTMAMQTWATILLNLSAQLYNSNTGGRAGKKVSSKNEVTVDEAQIENSEDQAEYRSLVEWSLPYVLRGCCFDQFQAREKRLQKKKKNAKREQDESDDDAAAASPFGSISIEDREAAEQVGWTYIYYSLRCMEAMAMAIPNILYPMVAQQLVPHLVQVLLSHSHRWVRGAAWRLLGHYMYYFVEEKMSIMTEDYYSIEEGGETEASQEWEHLPYCVSFSSKSLSEPRALKVRSTKVFVNFASLTKALLERVASSDVDNEKYMAHEAMNDKSRTSLIKLLLFSTKAMSHLSLNLLLYFPPETVDASINGVDKRTMEVLQKQFLAWRNQVKDICHPVVRHQSVKHFMVRSATMCQYFGGLVSLLPHTAQGEPNSTEQTINTHIRYLLGTNAMRTLSLLHETVLPFIHCVLRSSTPSVSEKLHTYAHNALQLIEKQLEDRRTLFENTSTQGDEEVGQTDRKESSRSKKRERVASINDAFPKKHKKRKESLQEIRNDAEGGKEGEAKDSMPHLSEVLALLHMGLAEALDTKREKIIRKETTKVLKRNRHERSKQ